MTRLINAIPVLPAGDIAVALAFYQTVLGFRVAHQDAEYAIVERDAVEVHLWLCPDRRIAENTSCRLIVDDVEQIYQRVQQAGAVHPNGALEDKPWGSREFAALDPSGNLVWFVQPNESQISSG